MDKGVEVILELFGESGGLQRIQFKCAFFSCGMCNDFHCHQSDWRISRRVRCQ